jgi:hypothetical protein
MDGFASPDEFKESCGYVVGDYWYPRVTRIVEIKAKPALYRFYGRMQSFAEGERVKKQSATEGTMIHEAAEAIMLGGEPAVPSPVAPAIVAFREFLGTNRIHVEPEFVERRLVNEDERYAGTLDAVATIGGKTGILDIKTSQEIYRDYNLQTAAYFAAMAPIVPNLETRWILRIDQNRPCIHCGAVLRSKGGKHQVKTKFGNPFMQACTHEWGPPQGRIELKEFPAWQNDFRAFLGAKKLWEWENEDWLRKIGYL